MYSSPLLNGTIGLGGSFGSGILNKATPQVRFDSIFIDGDEIQCRYDAKNTEI